MQNGEHDYILYGTPASPTQVESFLSHMFKSNDEAEANGKRKTPICIWGKHGIGKTELVEAYAANNGYQFAYIAPAQFEEMGDLIGMPSLVNGKTEFAPPKWVPASKGPGILLIDDLNRADDRILRGLMQLFQVYSLSSWSLPPQWQIVATANPDGGDYSVTPLDDAMITRMMHITMKFDLIEWSMWAENQGIDQRGIQFVLSRPGIFTENRTTPRTLVQFFDAIKSIDDLESNANMVQLLADACLTPSTTGEFWDFVTNDLKILIGPEEILATNDFETEILPKIMDEKSDLKLKNDQLFTIMARLSNHLNVNPEPLSEMAKKNLERFITLPALPADLRLGFARRLSSTKNPAIKEIFLNPQIGSLLLSGL
ncbi:MAG: AAA family ATPase [Bacteroidota bacterium]